MFQEQENTTTTINIHCLGFFFIAPPLLLSSSPMLSGAWAPFAAVERSSCFLPPRAQWLLIVQNGGVCLITSYSGYSMTSTAPNDGYQLCKQPPRPRSIFIVFEQQCYISWPPLSTTRAGHSKQKIHSIDPPMSPQLLFPNSH